MVQSDFALTASTTARTRDAVSVQAALTKSVFDNYLSSSLRSLRISAISALNILTTYS